MKRAASTENSCNYLNENSSKYGCIFRVRLLRVFLCHSPWPLNFGQIMSKGFPYCTYSRLCFSTNSKRTHTWQLCRCTVQSTCAELHIKVFLHLYNWFFEGRLLTFVGLLGISKFGGCGTHQNSGNPGKIVSLCNISHYNLNYLSAIVQIMGVGNHGNVYSSFAMFLGYWFIFEWKGAFLVALFIFECICKHCLIF